MISDNLVTLTIEDKPREEEAVCRELFPLISQIENPVGVEIGIYEATNSWWLLHTHPTLRLHGVDPYVGYQDWYPGGFLSQDSVDNAYRIMESRLRPYSDRWTLHRCTSDDAVSLFSDDSLDFVFIDGLHEYEQVLKDCRNYYPKVKKGRIFAGHDYAAIEGVKQAVHQFADEVTGVIGEPVRVYHYPASDVWFWIK